MADAVSLFAGPQDLSGELCLQQALKDVGGKRRPVLGGIPLLAKIGKDSTGTQYYAIHPGLEREVAVKVMPCEEPACLRQASPRTAMLLAHANAALRVKSARVVELLEFAKEAGVIFFVTEYAQGKSAESYLNALRSQLKTGLDEGVALEISVAAAEGLAAVHAANLLHLDVRPANISIPAGQGDVLVSAEAKLDCLGQAYNGFVARLLAGTRAHTGTPGFMSPEQALGADAFTAACDVFSFGATLYALLAGQSPFDGPELEAIIASTVSRQAGSVRTWRPDVSRATASVIEICLRKNPASRFLDASVLHKALLICRDARSGTTEAQDAAVAQIESLAPPEVAPEVAQAPPEPVPSSQDVPPASTGPRPDAPPPGPVEAAVEQTLISGAAPALQEEATVASTQMQTTPELTLLSAPVSSGSRVSEAKETRGEGLESPVLQQQPIGLGGCASSPRPVRHSLRIALAAVVLLALGGAGAWQLGWLGKWIKLRPRAPTSVAANTSPASSKAAQERLAAEAKAKAEEQKKEEERRAANAKAKAAQERLAAEEKAKAEQERLAAEAKAKAEQERLAAEAKAKAEQERLAAEAKAKAELERLAAEAKVKAEEQKKEEERRAAEAFSLAKAEQERLAAEARTKAKEQKKEEERRAAEAIIQGRQTSQPTAHPAGSSYMLAPGVTIEFVSVPGGSFKMGTERATLENLAVKSGADPKQYLDETPAHQVVVPPFCIGRGPVSVAQFRAFAAATGHRTTAERRGEAYTLRDGAWQRTPSACWRNPGFQQGDDHPVVLVSFRDCVAFAAWAARTTGKPLRLPTEAEWEYAGRGQKGTHYPWGDEWSGRLANHCDASLKPFGLSDWKYCAESDGFPFTSPIGKFGNQSWCGAVDLAGNVLQWCSDAYEPYPQSRNAPQLLVDEADVPLDAPRVLRGGSYLSMPLDCRSGVRRSSSPRSASCEFGVRLAFTPEAR